MEFKKIDDNKFQCLLFEEDLEYNNITLDDFFRNDTEKIHNLLDVVMEEASRNIGVELNGNMMSLQLAPQPDHSILLTVSSGKEDFGNMLRHAGEKAAKAFSDNYKDSTKGNVIKNAGDDLKPAEFTAFDKIKDIFEEMKQNDESFKAINPDDLYKKPAGKKVSKVETVGQAVYMFDSFDNFEEMCVVCPKIWGVGNSLYKMQDKYYLVLEKGRCAKERYYSICNIMSEYASFDSDSMARVTWIKENCEVIIDNNAIGKMKKYML